MKALTIINLILTLSCVILLLNARAICRIEVKNTVDGEEMKILESAKPIINKIRSDVGLPHRDMGSMQGAVVAYLEAFQPSIEMANPPKK